MSLKVCGEKEGSVKTSWLGGLDDSVGEGCFTTGHMSLIGLVEDMCRIRSEDRRVGKAVTNGGEAPSCHQVVVSALSQ